MILCYNGELRDIRKFSHSIFRIACFLKDDVNAKARLADSGAASPFCIVTGKTPLSFGRPELEHLTEP